MRLLKFRLLGGAMACALGAVVLLVFGKVCLRKFGYEALADFGLSFAAIGWLVGGMPSPAGPPKRFFVFDLSIVIAWVLLVFRGTQTMFVALLSLPIALAFFLLIFGRSFVKETNGWRLARMAAIATCLVPAGCNIFSFPLCGM